MKDALDAIMQVMVEAFDPAYGEAWTRRQVGDAIILSNIFHILGDANGEEPQDCTDIACFALSRHVVGEEELLLIAVSPQHRGKGAGRRLMQRFLAAAEQRGAQQVFLEMRDGNVAENLYRSLGFTETGRRNGYYRSGTNGPFDAITFARNQSGE